MPFVSADGIKTKYEIRGSGPPLLMYAPGGFDARIEQWENFGIYKRIKLLKHLPEKYTCILFDRRENGKSGGRVETITWDHYVRQGVSLLDALEIPKAHVLGGCMGCCPVSKFAVAFPDRTLSIILYWPVGGAKYRINGHARFKQHLNFVKKNGLQSVVDLVRSHNKNFSEDPKGGPWGQPIRNSDIFAKNYTKIQLKEYVNILEKMYKGLLDRDTSPGAEPEDLLKLNIRSLIIPGNDDAHATSAAMYLHECIKGSVYWNVPVDSQTEKSTSNHILDFLENPVAQ